MKTVLVFTKEGRVIRFGLNEIPAQRRNGLGIRAIRLAYEDEVVAVVTSEECVGGGGGGK